ncbi:MAG: 2,4-dihydroxyhept-2-ene-1,7-dioic acid aldolase [Acidobacteriia bacterium]|nr:2,4-dihydroxyhept-2-ene-1,7-dioic acid aldolase [Terriglobia bacterium]
MPDFVNPLKERLAAGDPVLGSWVWFTDPCSAEMMAQAGFDWLLIDVEHSHIGPEALRNIIMAVDRYECAPIVRTKVGDIDSIKVSLDAGAMGVIIPQINTPEEAQWAVKHTKYAPLGKRGIGAMRATSYGTRWDEYLSQANEQILTIVQIEDRQAVDNLPHILSTPGLDGIFVGAFDLSQSMGFLPGQTDPRLDATIDQVIDAARSRDLIVGACVTWDNVDSLVSKGVTLPIIGADVEFMFETARDCTKKWRQAREKVSVQTVGSHR